MESVFANDSTADLQAMLMDTQQRKEALLEEVASCQDCVYDIEQELSRRN